MSWLRQNRRFVRFIFLVLFVVALLGPWTYTLDGVPPAEFCDERFVLVDGVRCADLISGITIIAWMPLLIVGVIFSFLSGELHSWLSAAYVVALVALVVVPFFSNLLLLKNGGSLRGPGFHRTALTITTVVGASLPFLMRLLDRPLSLPLSWGIWLYAATALVALSLELHIARRSPPSPRQQGFAPAVE